MSDNPRVAIGNNSGAAATDVVNVTNLENVLRVCRAEFNAGAQIKRHANEKIRDERADFRARHTDVYEEINAIMLSARERLQQKLRNSENYRQAEDEKRDGSLRMKAAMKKLKDAGGDVQAFKIANKMADMDPVERGEFFDAIDLYAKGLRLWGDGF
ncbi:hypothetical protein APY04_0177 [Hyphomicrobium sulfonivorans]|uniref:Uncharacterized protein n=1 Tax=Hyphomicrobium sulfonivorans TaxID=121290 RepID=A0A109BP56_HYPSL|nr:hypothetical protein APY04_0177 [Hyphomicrobium sulfonivorans]